MNCAMDSHEKAFIWKKNTTTPLPSPAASDTQNPTAMVDDAITCLKMMHSEAAMKLTIRPSNFDGELSPIHSPSAVEKELDTKSPRPKIVGEAKIKPE